jgi:hypothetical protein
MSMYFPKGREQRQLASAGMHPAVCNHVVDLGTQRSGNSDPKHQLHIGWELTDEPTSNGRLFEVSKRYNFTAHPMGGLWADLESWLGRALTADDLAKLDLASLIGRTATIGVIHVNRGERTFANVASVMRPAKGGPTHLTCSGGGVSFSLSDSPFDQAAYDALPAWLRTVIANSPGYQAVIASPTDTRAALANILQPPPREDLNDEIPF